MFSSNFITKYEFSITPNIFGNISGKNSLFMKEAGPNLIEKILF